jgi:hypothetical protein
MSMHLRLMGFVGAVSLSAALLVTGAGTAAAASSGSTCSGGPVPAGTYKSLTITGSCEVVAGDVTVEGNLKVSSTGLLNALFSGSTLTVGGNLIVQQGGLLALGCDPEELACFDNPQGTSSHSIGGNLVADGAILMIVHDNRISGNVSQEGGGGGFSCSELFPHGPPAYTDYANNVIGGAASVTGLRTCWDGFSHNVVGKSVEFSNNQTAIPDGNLADGNHIARDFSCLGDSPAPHLSDGPVKTPNVVGGVASGQCAAISV